MVRKWDQEDEWFQRWFPIVNDVMAAWDAQKGKWNYFPFHGGLYDQDRTNALTWEIWHFIANRIGKELEEIRTKQEEKTISAPAESGAENG